MIESQQPTEKEIGAWLLGGIAMYYWYRWIRLGRPEILPEFSIYWNLEVLLPYAAIISVCCYWYLYICVTWTCVDSPSWIGEIESS